MDTLLVTCIAEMTSLLLSLQQTYILCIARHMDLKCSLRAQLAWSPRSLAPLGPATAQPAGGWSPVRLSVS